ncbi:hypothetical protein HYC85_018523 [Camellia sinensis]|uniref:Uncharacterized protein n=1 Tax=Camellia sinensis TaxID=4442 RepID=A0A7J7GY78_CAMSI|nr:hypothetical protein HYC85_018523 [Camellia sinensis]
MNPTLYVSFRCASSLSRTLLFLFLFLSRADYVDLQFFKSRVSQHFLEASHYNDLKSTLDCISDQFVDVNFVGAVCLKLSCRNELANEVRVEYKEFKTDVMVFFLAIHARTMTLIRKLLVKLEAAKQKIGREICVLETPNASPTPNNDLFILTGTKFGGYGSFLPTYQRSPVWSRPRSPPKNHNYSTPKSPNNLHLKGSCHNSVVPCSASLSVRHGLSSTNAALLPSLRSSNNTDMSSAHCAEESSSRCELVKNCAQPSDQKTLKVQIKVGSDNLLTQKNAKIYTGLGLDISPSSSLNESPTDSEGFSHEPLDAPEESPTSILQNHIDKGTQNGIGVPLKKETNIDTSACEELVANTLKLPLLSNSYPNVANPDKGTASRAVHNTAKIAPNRSQLRKISTLAGGLDGWEAQHWRVGTGDR